MTKLNKLPIHKFDSPVFLLTFHHTSGFLVGLGSVFKKNCLNWSFSPPCLCLAMPHTPKVKVHPWGTMNAMALAWLYT